MQEILSGKVVSLQSGHQPRWIYGLFAQRPGNPGLGDTYYCTDTKEFDVCYTAGTWTAIVSGGGGGIKIMTITVSAHALTGQAAHGLGYTPSPIGMPNPDSAAGNGAMGSCDGIYAYITLPAEQEIDTTFTMGVS